VLEPEKVVDKKPNSAASNYFTNPNVIGQEDTKTTTNKPLVLPNTPANGLATTTTISTHPITSSTATTTTTNIKTAGPIKTSKINKLTKKSIPYEKKQNADSNSQSDHLVSPVTRSKSETSIKLIGLDKLIKPFDIIQTTSNLKTKNDEDNDFKSSLYQNKVENLKLYLNLFEEIFSKINGKMIKQ
jgi:hypothetical protein